MIQGLLEGAEKVIANAPHTWLVTQSESGVNARPMGRVTASPTQTDWRLGYLADARSRKVRDISFARQVRLIVEHEEDAFLSLAGAAEVITDTVVITRRWLPAYDRIFPTADDKANAVFIDIRAEELRLWIRGLTPEPFGISSLTLRRPFDGDWYLDKEPPQDVAAN